MINNNFNFTKKNHVVFSISRKIFAKKYNCFYMRGKKESRIEIH